MSESNHKIKVLIAEDSKSIRKWYLYALGAIEDIELLPMASSGYEAVALAAMHMPDVVVLDMEMENREAGLQAGYQIKNMMPDVKIIMLTVYDDDATIFRTYEMGAIDYLFKDASIEKIADAIRDAYNEISPIRPEIAHRIRGEFSRLKRKEDSLMEIIKFLKQLSPTESDIVIMLFHGLSRYEICEQRFIEMSTLKTHIRNILKKTNVTDIDELLELVRQEKLLPYLSIGTDNNQLSNGDE